MGQGRNFFLRNENHAANRAVGVLCPAGGSTGRFHSRIGNLGMAAALYDLTDKALEHTHLGCIFHALFEYLSGFLFVLIYRKVPHILHNLRRYIFPVGLQ